MREFKYKLYLKKEEFKTKVNKFKYKLNYNKEKTIALLKENIPETFFIVGLIIIGLNSLAINTNFGWYVIALESLIMSKIIFNSKS